MKREEKNALSRQRILEAAMGEFSARGYAGASLNTVCAEYGISKGILYHYFKDKDALYLVCVQDCFDHLTAALRQAADALEGSIEARLQAYFHARLRFFAENSLYLGIFADAAFNAPPELATRIAACREGFDAVNLSVLTDLLSCVPLREGLSGAAIADDFRLYMDYFNMRFREAAREKAPSKAMLQEHEERCHRQLDILLHGVIGEKNA